jgi:hypothetical protein
VFIWRAPPQSDPPHSASPGRAWRVSSACSLSYTGHLVRARSGVGAARERLEKLLRVHCHGLLFAVACDIAPLQYHGTLSGRSFSGAETAPQMLRMGKCVRNRETEPCKRSGSSGTRRAGGRGGQGAANAHMSAKSGAADMARDRVAAIARVGRVLQAICPHPSTTRIDRRACKTARANRRQQRRATTPAPRSEVTPGRIGACPGGEAPMRRFCFGARACRASGRSDL